MTNTLVGKRVHDLEEMLGNGTVLKHDAVEALVLFDNDTEPMWVRWHELELINEHPTND